nr:hypothetical protein [uncultured Massilia sp.]
MRNINLEAAIWNLFASIEFFEAAAQECDDIVTWFGGLAVSKKVANFGRNNQIFDTFRVMARDFRRGADLARCNEYKLILDTARYVRGDIRGMMEQPLHSWMTTDEYQEFSSVKISRLLSSASQITSVLHNAIFGATLFFDPDPEWPEGSNEDGGFPGDEIVKWYKSELDWYQGKLRCDLPDPLPEYVIDKSIACKTGDEVPWTGVWYPATGLERHSLTFAIKGLRMQPVYRVVKTSEELSTEDWESPPPQTVAVATTWHPLIPSGRPAAENEEGLRAKAGEACPKAGIWQPMEPGAAHRYYAAGEKMVDFKSAYGITVWRWIADR